MRRPGGRWFAAALLAAALGAATAPAAADDSNRIVEWTGQGRYGEVAHLIEQRPAGERSTGEWHALCYSYAQLKRYAPLFACLDQLEAASHRDGRTLLFGLDDAAPTIHLMRAEALIDLGRAEEAFQEAGKAVGWFAQEGGDGEVDIRLDALAARTVAAAALHDPARSQAALDDLLAVRLDSRAARRFVTVRAMALARAHLALHHEEAACAALDEDPDFDRHRAIERLLHAGAPNWIWQHLPRAYMRARCLSGSGHGAEARALYDALLALPDVEQNRGIHWQLLFDRGRIAEADGDLQRALDLYLRVLAVIEEMRASVDTEASKIGFVADKQEPYGAALDLLVRLGRADQAVEIMERAKSRALVDLLAGRFGDARHLDLVRGDARLSGLLSEQREIEAALDEQAPVRSGHALQDTRLALQRVKDTLRHEAPGLASLVAVDPVTAGDLRAPLGATEVAVEFFLFHGRLLSVTYDRAGSHVHAAPVGDLRAQVEEFRHLVMDTRLPQRRAQLERALYDQLFRPLEAELGQRPLLIVPHAELNYVPFAALHDGHQYLAWRQPLRVSPSASALRYLHAPTPGGPSGLLIFANPTLDLPGAKLEAERVAHLAGSAQVHSEREATKQAFLEAAPRFRRIHFAGHGQYEPERPLDSELYFAKAGSDDGLLHASEIYALRLDADLVTLSACETGIGRVTDGGDVIGLMRAFLYAGARSVVSTLWEISDDATLALMENFYRNLATMNKRDALRAAQQQTAVRYPEPFYWAAFYLVGSAD